MIIAVINYRVSQFFFGQFGLCLLFFFLLSLAALGQSGSVIRGKIIDEKDQSPVPFAQVALYEEGEDAPLVGTVTGEDGTFELQAEKGKYELEVAFVGYENKRINVRIRNRDKNIGTITLASEAQQLEAVVVESEAIEEEVEQPITTNMEGIQVNPEQMATNAGGSLLDVLRNTPSVNVGEDGGVSLRGSSGTNILIDGRNSALATDLEQIPASAIESIQIVNNPNSKYDAQAAGGIINIKLKHGENIGTRGGVDATIGTRYRLNTAARLSHRTLKYAVYGGYSFRRWPRAGSRTTIRETFEDNERLEQYGDSDRRDTEHTVNYGAEYFFGNNILSYEGAFNMEEESDIDNTLAQLYNRNSEDLLLQYFRSNAETEDNTTFDNALIYERTFENPDRSFRALVSNSYRDQLEEQHINVYSGESSPTESPTGMERSFTDELRSTTIVQADYVHPFETVTLEAGYKSIFRSFDNDYHYEIYEEAGNTWLDQPEISNRFLYTDQVHAVYLIYSQEFGKFQLSAGSRLEQTFVTSKLYNTGEENDQEYLNLFPSVQAMYNVNDMHSFKFTYSRRIDRPNAWRLNPFPDISDSLSVRVGNPNLQPELIHSLEAGHMFHRENIDVTTNLFYRHVSGQLDYIVRIEDGISYRRPENLNSSVTYGAELINTTELYSWWNLNASVSLFRVQVDGSNLGTSNFDNEGFSWYAKFTSDFSLPEGIGLQLTGNYTAPEIEAQGRDLARYYLDASLTRGFFEDKLNLSLTLRDVFNTRRFAGESYTDEFIQTFERRRESRILLLNLRYNFTL